MEVAVPGARLPLTLALPTGPVVAGCVALHPAGDGTRSQPLLQHLADVLPRCGVAVLLHDRRPDDGVDDVPLRTQAADARAVAAVLRDRVGPVPVGVWGHSQGAWSAALVAAADVSTPFLVLVSGAGVSPAQQMRHADAEHLRRAGVDERAVAELLDVRAAYEDALRGRVPADVAQRRLDDVAERPWRGLVHLAGEVGPDDRWTDLDHDPGPVLAATTCPVLAVWGEDDPWVPVDVSEAASRRALGDRLTVLRLPGVGHEPQPADPRYERALLAHVQAALST